MGASGQPQGENGSGHSKDEHERVESGLVTDTLWSSLSVVPTRGHRQWGSSRPPLAMATAPRQHACVKTIWFHMNKVHEYHERQESLMYPRACDVPNVTCMCGA